MYDPDQLIERILQARGIPFGVSRSTMIRAVRRGLLLGFVFGLMLGLILGLIVGLLN